MLRAVADTHAVIWYQYADPRLSKNAKAAFDGAVRSGDSVGVSAITLVEMVYLIEKGRIASDALSRTTNALTSPGSVLALVPLDANIANALTQVSRSDISDMPG
jgi:PIN domain nuclease of toxin-antitoxin system